VGLSGAMSGHRSELSVTRKLAYIGDVPVENALHGSAQLFRILRNWRPDCLRIIQFDRRAWEDRQLADVIYLNVKPPAGLVARFGTLRYVFGIPGCLLQIDRALASFRPEAILTIAHGREWVIAYLFAQRLRVPLYLIVHDAGLQSRRLTGRFRAQWLTDTVFGIVYRRARARFCVSPYMEEEYRRQYGVEGDVLLPIVGNDCAQLSIAHQRRRTRALRIAFAGSLAGLESDLMALAQCLSDCNGELLLYGAADGADATLLSNLGSVVKCMPRFKTESELIASLHGEADAAYLPMSFNPEVAENVRLSFPSKLTAYTAAALPVLIRAPAYASAVRWAQDKPAFGTVVCDPNPEALSDALDALRDSRAAEQWAAHSLDLCTRFFRSGDALRLIEARLSST
jgi:hypothetical protein